MIKWIIALVVIVAAGAGLWYSGMLNQWLPSMQPAQTATQTATTTQAAQQQQPQNDLPTATNDASDAAILQDTAAIDAQMQSYSSDSANVSSGINDKPVTQEY